jgi:hypothetical protein
MTYEKQLARKNYHRKLLGFHIHGWKAEFLSQCDAEQFAECVSAGRIRSLCPCPLLFEAEGPKYLEYE